MVVSIVLSRTGSVTSKGSKVTGSIVNTFATCTIEEMFENESSQAAESCSLMIDAGREYVIYNVKITKAAETIEFSVEELEEAKDNFQTAQAQGYFTAFGAKDASADALRLEIGNIEPQTSFIISFQCTFSAFLETKNSVSFSFPFKNYFINSKFATEMKIHEDQKISKISVSNNTFTTTIKNIDDDSLLLQSSCEELKSRPSIKIEFEEEVASSAVSCNINGEKFIGASVIPSIGEGVTAKSEVIIIIDCSGSMSGDKMKIAKETLKIFIKSLPFDSFFNVIRFGSNFESMFEESVLYDREHSSAALNQSESMNANLGGTDLLSPLTYVFDLKEKEGFVRQIFIITDGQVENEGLILSLARKHRMNHRLFSVGIGKDVASGFIRELAECSLGTSTIIEENSDCIIKATMEQLKSSLAPAISEVQLHVDATDSFEVAPFPTPPIFATRINTIFFKITDKSLDNISDFDILLSGKIGSEDQEIVVRSHGFDQSRFQIDFDKIFAFNNIQDMEEAIASLSQDPSKDTSVMKANVIRLSMQTNILSQYTGLFTMINGKKIDNRAQQQEQANEHLNSMQFSTNQQQPQQGYDQHIQMQQGFTNRQQWNQNLPRNHCQVNQRQQWNSGQQQAFSSFGQQQAFSSFGQQQDCFSHGLQQDCFSSQQSSSPNQQQRNRVNLPTFGSKFVQQPSPSAQQSFPFAQKPCSFADQQTNMSHNNQCIPQCGFGSSRRGLCLGCAQPQQVNSSNNGKKEFSLEQLIQDQDFEGFWDGLDDLQDFIGKKMPDEILRDLNGCNDKIICTILVLALLNKEFRSEESVWRLIYDKALSWLRKASNMENVEGFIARCSNLIE